MSFADSIRDFFISGFPAKMYHFWPSSWIGFIMFAVLVAAVALHVRRFNQLTGKPHRFWSKEMDYLSGIMPCLLVVAFLVLILGITSAKAHYDTSVALDKGMHPPIPASGDLFMAALSGIVLLCLGAYVMCAKHRPFDGLLLLAASFAAFGSYTDLVFAYCVEQADPLANAWAALSSLTWITTGIVAVIFGLLLGRHIYKARKSGNITDVNYRLTVV